MLELTVTGLDTIANKFKRFSIVKVVRNTMDDSRLQCELDAIRNCPVYTGRLRESIFSYPTEKGFVIGAGNDVVYWAEANEYGLWVNTPAGTVETPLPARYQGYRPFIRPAIMNTMNLSPKIFGEYVDEEFGGK